jgi:hypothetical protein
MTRVAVTGHRFLRDESRLFSIVADVLQMVLHTFPGRPLCVISPLAEGADRLVAECVLEVPGSTLVAVLPLPEEEYMEDFKTAASRATFRELLTRAKRVVVLPRRRSARKRSDVDLRKRATRRGCISPAMLQSLVQQRFPGRAPAPCRQVIPDPVAEPSPRKPQAIAPTRRHSANPMDPCPGAHALGPELGGRSWSRRRPDRLCCPPKPRPSRHGAGLSSATTTTTSTSLVPTTSTRARYS